MRNVPPAALAAPGATHFVAFRAVVDDFVGTLAREEPGHAVGASSGSAGSVVQPGAATRGFFGRKTEKNAPAQTAKVPVEEETEPEELTSHSIVDKIVALVLEECTAAGAVDEDDETFVVEEEIQRRAITACRVVGASADIPLPPQLGTSPSQRFPLCSTPRRPQATTLALILLLSYLLASLTASPSLRFILLPILCSSLVDFALPCLGIPSLSHSVRKSRSSRRWNVGRSVATIFSCSSGCA